MSKLDQAVVLLLIFIMVTVGSVSIYVDVKMDKTEAAINDIYAKQAAEMARLSSLVSATEEHAERIDALETSDQIQNIRLAMHRDELTENAQMFTDLLSSYDRLEEHLKSLPKNALGIEVSDKDIRNIAALVYLEAGSQSCSYKLKKAIASVIFNRMIRYGKTADQVIYENGVFSPASRVSSTNPSSSCLMAVREVLEEGTTLPRNVVAFQLYGYHRFGRPYCKIDNVYFTAI